MRSSPLLHLLRADWAANKANPKGLVVITAFRLAHQARGTGRPPVWSIPILVTYRLLVDWILGIEIPPSVQAGPGLCIWHGTGLVLHKDVQLGSNVTLRHGVTIGTLGEQELSAAPVLGDSVSVGAGAIILGPYQIGEAAVIGAGAVVVTDVPAGATVVGNPGRILPSKGSTEQ